MTTQADFLTRARVRLDESTARQWADSDIRGWLNEGARDIARKTESLQERGTIAAVVGTAEYSLTTMDADIIRVHRVEFKPTSGQYTRELEYADVKGMDGFGWEQRSLTDTQPYAYTVWGSARTLKMIVHPAPSEAGNFTVYYYHLPAALAESSNADQATHIEIPPGWDDILLDYVEYRALRKDRDPRWVEAKGLYDENLSLMFDNTRRWVDQAGAIVPHRSALPDWLVAFD